MNVSFTDAFQPPFKGLAPFELSDAPIFFGREVERRQVTANLNAAPLTLLYGPTGVGKTSLLNAGVAEDFRTRRRDDMEVFGRRTAELVIFRDWKVADPVTSLVRAARAAVSGGDCIEKGPVTGALDEEFYALTIEYDLRLLVVLDQFEEHFLYSPASQRGRFDREFAVAASRPDLRVNFVVALREDLVAGLDRYKGAIPNLFQNYLRLGHVNEASARKAIVEPIRWYNDWQRRMRPDLADITIESDLVDAILDQVQAGELLFGELGKGGVESILAERRFEAPYLQLVLMRLWKDEISETGRVLRLATFKKLGGAEKIVRQHVEKAMMQLSGRQQNDGGKIFRYLVTPSGSKVAYTASDLAEYASVSLERTKDVLELLTAPKMRILRSVTPAPGQDAARFEIYHDVLAGALADWRRQRQVRAAVRANVLVAMILALLSAIGFLVYWAWPSAPEFVFVLAATAGGGAVGTIAQLGTNAWSRRKHASE